IASDGARNACSRNAGVIAEGMTAPDLASEFERVFSSRPAQRVSVGQQAGDVVICRGGSASERLTGLETDGVGTQTDKDRITVEIRIEALRGLSVRGVVKSIEGVAAGTPHAAAKLIDQRRRQGRREVQGQGLRVTEKTAPEAIRPRFECTTGIACRPFVGVR